MTTQQDIINETWRSISGYINYQVSNIGRIRNCVSGRILSGITNDNGYRIIDLRNEDGIKKFRVHVLVATEFIDKPESNDKLYVDHINHNRTDNQVHNLRWVTKSQNQMNATKTSSKTSSEYKGVSFDKRSQKWQAYIMLNRKRIHIGYFNDENTAGEAYNNKALELFGEFAHLNQIVDDF